MPNDMYHGKLPAGTPEYYPHHVYLKTIRSGPWEVNLSAYFLPAEITEWLDQHCAGGYQFRKDIGDRPNPFANPAMTPVLCFTNPDEAFAFKMRWVGEA